MSYLSSKLLSLLNVAATKPSFPTDENYQTDWNTRARPPKEHSSQPTEGDQHRTTAPAPAPATLTPSPSSPTADVYSTQFGPESSLPPPADQWSISAKETLDNVKRVQFSHPEQNTSNAAPVIPPRFLPAIHKFGAQQKLFFNSINHYHDVWHTDLPYTHTRANLRAPTAIWALQHILKTRNQIIKNNEHLNHATQKKLPNPAVEKDGQPPQNEPSAHPSNDPPDIRDQGFTRPKVLLLLPFRSSALDWVKTITSASSCTDQTVKGLERFESDFSLPEGTVDKLDSEDARFKYSLDHRIIFRGNIDDDFKLAVKFNRKEIKLYSEFYQSDLIVASPVGLRKFIEKEGDSDFLSSIEVVIVDQMDVMQMQNWDHVEFVFEHLNQIPAKPRDTDFSRVKPWYLDGHGRHHRQTILFSSLISPEQNSLFRSLTNGTGKSIYFHQTEAYRTGQLSKIRRGIEQTWLKLDHTNLDHTNEDDRRLDFFRSNILNLLQQSALVKAGLGGVLIFIPSYFDFVRLENLLRSIDDLKFAAISEYSTPSEISAARSSFFNRHVSYLLITERFHFYHRYKIRGARKIIFYGAPLHAEYYLEFVNEYPFLENLNKTLIEEKKPKNKKEKKNDVGGDQQDQTSRGIISPDELQVQVIFSKFDKYKVEKIVGISDCSKIFSSFHSLPDDLNNANSFTFI